MMLGEGLFCVLGRPILQSSYRFPQYCNVSKASYSASGLFLFSGSIGSISIAEVYLLAHLVVIATLIHVAMLFPDAIHHKLHSRMFFNVQLLFGDGYFLRELVFWMPSVVASSVYHHSGRVEYVPISFYESQCFIESSTVSFLIRFRRFVWVRVDGWSCLAPSYSEMVRSYSEVVPGWCAGL